ncbi:MAG TPA: RagB/SusD family nutrient uptake outer membrane protein, partial [Macellibacteroides fermentans]|nr:RagB/SusD family nutrient uptake outer membrane protein [Macellibacteroides fermentans]
MKSLYKFGKVCFSILSLGFLLAGCTDSFLDRPPLGSLDEDTYLKTEDAGLKLLVNCYQPIVDHWSYQTMKFDLGDQLTSDASKGGSDAGDRSQITEVGRGNPLATNSMFTDLWNHRYKVA